MSTLEQYPSHRGVVIAIGAITQSAVRLAVALAVTGSGLVGHPLLGDRTASLHAARHRLGLDFHRETHGHRNSDERVFRELTRRTGQFSNVFSHVNPDTTE